MNTKEKLFSALNDLIAEDRNHFARDLAAMLRRLYPTDKPKINAMMKRKDTTQNKVDIAHVQQVESKTYQYGEPSVQAAVLPKKKAVAERQIPSHELSELSRGVGFEDEGAKAQTSIPKERTLSLPTPSGGISSHNVDKLLAMDENELITVFGTLPELKAYLKGVLGVSIKRNATTETAVSAFKEAIRETYD